MTIRKIVLLKICLLMLAGAFRSPLLIAQMPPAFQALPYFLDEQIDFGIWALQIDKELDPTIDILPYSQQIDSLAQTVKKILPVWEKDLDVLYATKIVLYEQGPWNQNQPFRYDLDDPLAKNPRSRMLTTYLETRKGNCVTMPLLVIAIIHRIDPNIPIAGVLAPQHNFCRIRDRVTGKVLNFEATIGQPARDEWIIETHEISQTALDSGLYMRDLTPKEYAANLLSSLVDKEFRLGNYTVALGYNEFILSIFPHSPVALVKQGAILHTIGYETLILPLECENREPTHEEWDAIQWYDQEGAHYIETARKLGWEESTQESEARYLKLVADEKNAAETGGN